MNTIPEPMGEGRLADLMALYALWPEGLKVRVDDANVQAARAMGTLAAAVPELVAEVRRLTKAVNQAERQLHEALRAGAGRGEEYVLGAHRTLIGTGLVRGYTGTPPQKAQACSCGGTFERQGLSSGTCGTVWGPPTCSKCGAILAEEGA